jgi:phage tail sheath gpL-like
MALSTAFSPSDIARGVAIKTQFKDLRQGAIALLPQQLAIVGQGSSTAGYDLAPTRIFSEKEAGDKYGYGSPVHYAARELFPANGDSVGTIPVTVYPMDDLAGDAAKTLIDITGSVIPTVAAEVFTITVADESVTFTVNVGDTNADVTAAITAAINGNINMALTAADAVPAVDNVTTTLKWAGASGDAYNNVVITGPAGTGMVFVVTPTASVALNPDPTVALNNMADRWETMVLNCLEASDTTSLDLYKTFGETRWGPLVRKPMVVFTGARANLATLTAVGDVRKDDRVNSYLVNAGSADTEIVIAARMLSKIARIGNLNPPQDYGRQLADTLVPGPVADQWDYVQRDAAIKAGISSFTVKNELVYIADVVTFYHPDGEPVPGYRYVVDIVKLQNVIYNLDLIFNQPEWDGAPLIPDNQPTTNAAAKKPKMAVAAIAAMLDSLALNAIISDADTAKANTMAEIDVGNPKRLNVATTIQLSGNVNVLSIDLNFGFFFGTAAIIA